METTKPRRRWIWIVLGIVVAIVAICALLSLFFNSNLAQPLGLPGSPLCTETASMAVDATKLNQYNFCVKSGTMLSLSISNNTNSCKITGGVNPINVPPTGSKDFSLSPGQYKLNCGIQGIAASISSK